jgi:hypothetical protein
MADRPIPSQSPQRPAQSPPPPADLRVRAFVLSREQNSPVAGQPIAIVGRDSAGADRVISVLATNRIGYVSFRIPAARLTKLSDLRVGLLGGRELLPLPKGEKGDEGAESAILLTIEAPATQSQVAIGLPSFTDPDTLDFHLSPGSFSTDQDLIVGEDGKGIVPADLAARQFTLIKPVRELAGNSLKGSRTDPPLEVRQGSLLVFDQVWSPKGHALGDIVRSVPLAPGETSNRAQVDFAREERVARQEVTSEEQQLASTFTRDRSITDTMKAVIAQIGFEAAGGFAKKGVSFDKGAPTLLATGVAGAIDGGVRRIAATTVDTLTERVEQASTSLRALASSTFAEALVKERQVAETSNFTNYNKAHTLTLLYHSVVDRFEVKTSLRGKRDAIFVEAIPINFDIEAAVANAHLLRPALLDPSLAPCFAAAARALDCCDAPATPQSPAVTGFTVDLGIGGNAGAGELSLLVRQRDGKTTSFTLKHDGRYKANTTHNFTLTVTPPLPLNQITDVGLSYVGAFTDTRIEVASLAVRALVAEQNPTVLFEGAVNNTFRKGSQLFFSVAGPGLTVPEAEDPCVADRCCAARLVRHLAANQAYYNGVLWMSEDPLARALRFDRYLFDDGDTTPDTGTLLDAIENEPLAVFGRFLLFAKSNSELAASDKIEQIAHITLPTSGVHVEAILGHLPAAEKIDATLSIPAQLNPAPAITVATVQPTDDSKLADRLAATSFAATSALSLLSGTEPATLSALQAILTAITSANAITTPDAVGKLGELLKAVGDSLKDFKPEPEESKGNDGVVTSSDLA